MADASNEDEDYKDVETADPPVEQSCSKEAVEEAECGSGKAKHKRRTRNKKANKVKEENKTSSKINLEDELEKELRHIEDVGFEYFQNTVSNRCSILRWDSSPYNLCR